MNLVEQILVDALNDLDPNRIEGNSKNSPRNVRLVDGFVQFEIGEKKYSLLIQDRSNSISSNKIHNLLHSDNDFCFLNYNDTAPFSF